MVSKRWHQAAVHAWMPPRVARQGGCLRGGSV